MKTFFQIIALLAVFFVVVCLFSRGNKEEKHSSQGTCTSFESEVSPQEETCNLSTEN